MEEVEVLDREVGCGGEKAGDCADVGKNGGASVPKPLGALLPFVCVICRGEGIVVVFCCCGNEDDGWYSRYSFTLPSGLSTLISGIESIKPLSADTSSLSTRSL